MRNIPKNLDDKKDVENFLLAVKEEVTADKSHNSLSDVNGADSSSTDSTQNKHVSDYDIKKIADHMDEVSKHLSQDLGGSSNYISNIAGLSPIGVTPATGITRTVYITQSQIDHTQIGNIGTNRHDTIDTHIAATTGVHGATATPTASKIPIADASGKLDGWITASTYTGGKNVAVVGTTIDQSLEYGASAYRAGYNTITTSTWEKIEFDSLTTGYLDNDFDPLTDFDYTAPVEGYYHVDLMGGMSNVADGTEVRVAIYVNGSIVSYNNAYCNDPGATGTKSVRVYIGKDLKLAANDIITGYIWHNHGSDRDTISDDMYITIHFIG